MLRRRSDGPRERRDPDLRPIPGAYGAYAGAVVALALAAGAVVVAGQDWSAVAGEPVLWLFAGLVLAGELLPIQVPHRYAYDRVHVSTAFAFATLLTFGPAPAMLVYAACSLIADRVQRTPGVIAAFNAGQYALSIAAAGGVLALLGDAAPLASVAGSLGAIVLAGVACFVVNHLLAGASSALLTGADLWPYLRADAGFHVWTDGFQLALAPLIALAAEASAWFVPIACLPVLAIFLGGREAAINGFRASHDLLTGLHNRWAFNQRLQAAVGDGRVVLLAIDLDDFKLVNDTLGHHNGDELLRLVADRMRGVVRDEDVLARLGGDEFALLLAPGSTLEDGRQIADRLVAALHEPFELERLHLDVSASIGVATSGEQRLEADDLLRAADVALYEAKATGADHVVASGLPTPAWRTERLGISSELREGIERGELFLEYQPKVSLSRDGTQGAEALVRWRHPHLGVVAPEAFIPIAEQSGLIKLLTLDVLDAAIRQARAWQLSGRPIRVSVNLSTRNLLDGGLPADVERLLRRHGLPAALLQLEVTESRVAADLSKSRSVLEQLRAMGVMIAIDDFGTGFSSLTQLQQLPVDEIKIDKSFVMGMGTSAQDAAIVRSTIDLGRNLQLSVTAEGVETAEVRDVLAELGCHTLQGFLIGRPQDAETCARTLAAHAIRLEEAAA